MDVAEEFLMRGVDDDGVNMYMKAPSCKHGVHVITHHHSYGGDNQFWQYE